MKRHVKTLKGAIAPDATLLHLARSVNFLALVQARPGSELIKVETFNDTFRVTWVSP